MDIACVTARVKSNRRKREGERDRSKEGDAYIICIIHAKRASAQRTTDLFHKRATVIIVIIITITTAAAAMGTDRSVEVAKNNPLIDLYHKPIKRKKNLFLGPAVGSPAPHKSKRQLSRFGKNKDDGR